MVPAGAPTRETVAKLADLLDKGDLVIDGGNSRFTDDFENEKLLKAKGIGYLDCGVSGGIWGLENGYGLMVGGDGGQREAGHADLRRAAPRGPARRGLRPRRQGRRRPLHEDGPQRHRVRPDAAYAEGYELLEKKDIVTDVPGAFKAWSRGTVVRSWLLDLMVKALEENPDLEDVSDYTADSGEGRWTVEEAIALSVPMPVISASLFARFASRQESSPDDAGRRRAARPVRRARGHDDRRGRGAARRGRRRPRPPTRPTRPPARRRPPRSPKAAAAKGRKAAKAGRPRARAATPSSARAGAAPPARPRAPASTRKRAATKS